MNSNKRLIFAVFVGFFSVSSAARAAAPSCYSAYYNRDFAAAFKKCSALARQGNSEA